MQTYRNYSGPQQPGRSPSALRRGPGPLPHAGAAPTPRQLEQQQAAEMHRREAAKRQAKRPTDKNMPDGIEDVVIGDGVDRYKKLREVERRLDAVMMRKRLDISDSVNRTFRRHRTLRLCISNTAAHQPWQQTAMQTKSFDFGTDSQAIFRVKIEGRLMDDDHDVMDDEEVANDADGDAEKDVNAMDTDLPTNDAQAKAGAPSARAPERTRLSHFFKQITIDFDRSTSLQPDGYTQIEWKKPEKPPGGAPNVADHADFDCLEFERKSDENINVTIRLYRDESPERYRLSEPLARLLDTDEDDRAGVVMGIWSYILEMGLQQDEDARTVRLDENLKRIFHTQGHGQDVIMFSRIPDLVLNHLHPLLPVVLKYTIRVDKAYIDPPAKPATSTSDHASPAAQPQPSAPTIYDVQVLTTDPFRTALAAMSHFSPKALTAAASGRDTPAVETLKRLVALDDTLALAVQAITRSKAKHAFFTSLATDPVTFINRWVSSQRRDLHVIMGDSRGAVNGVGNMGAGWDETGREEWRWGGKQGVWGSKGATEAAGLYLGRMRRPPVA